MYGNCVTVNRVHVLLRILNNKVHGNIIHNVTRAYVSSDTVSIGNVSKALKDTKNPEYVPRKYYTDENPQSTLHHLRWIMEKDILGQDIFLIGPPGPRRRNIAMQYLELTNREHEYVALNRDTTESDLKQRREIVTGTATYFDQGAVRAAVNGRVLVLEGIEKAERNVLPVLNNLLENREMNLEDGRLLISASRYDKLLQQHKQEDLDKWKLVRVDENFRVIALGLPIPRFRGNPLDPPLRSRFQARDVHINSYQELYSELKNIAANAPQDKVESLLSAAFALLTKQSFDMGLPDFPLDNLKIAVKILEENPTLSTYNVFYRLYPYRTFLTDNITPLESLIGKFSVIPEEQGLFSNFSQKIGSLVKRSSGSQGDIYVETEYQNSLLQEMLQSAGAADLCFVGPRGSGKSMVVNKVAELLGKETENIVLYQDMTSRDLIQQRTTLENGDTVWKFSPLVTAAIEGKVAILDGIDRIHPSTLSVLHRLVQDRELQLHDGKRLISRDKYDYLKNSLNLSEERLKENNIIPIHPNFRIVAIGAPPASQSPTGNWMSPEILSLFVFHEMRTLSKPEEMHIITSKVSARISARKYGPMSKPLHQIVDLAHILRNSADPSLRSISGHLSTRQLLRIAARMAKFPGHSAYETIQEAFMTKFLPPLTRQSLEKTVSKLGIEDTTKEIECGKIKCEIKDDVLTIGNTSCPLHKADNLTKVPNILFYDVPQHLHLMENMLQDFQIGEHLLLVGNQGVGKNKVVDRFLELLNRPREYIQLHRDTTVQTLTTQPTVRDGLLVYEDSPLIKAIKNGYVLVVDEADKAPTHVTCILKTLVESGQMIFSDGRRVVKSIPSNLSDTSNLILMHPDFRMIVLANRPGFPFLGNDFFGALGDLFSSYAVDNPSKKAEIDLLQQYGPDVSVGTIKTLVDVFSELRAMSDKGLVSYPYSTREVVNIVKHMQQFPNSDIEDVIFNVFDFDKYNPEIVETLGEVLARNGFSSKNILTQEYIAAKRAKENIQVTVNRHSGLDTTAPKHGKEDPNNDPHVGGNTWAGGTGGRDTAGLGGKGGPYRLDKGHKVHQLSDEEKDAVPEHIKQAAREMGRKAFEQKLKEIGMSGYDATLYSSFSNAVSKEVQSLRVILSNLQAKNKERHWSRHQTSGELDDVKLIDGLLGEKTIFRRRTEQEPELGTPQTKPKLFRVLVDVSGSMYRFNGYDGRLDRELEAAVLVMEAFESFEDKIQYDIVGHSGDTHKIEFVNRKSPPKNNKERLDVIRTMHAHSQYCWSGDNTLAATEYAVTSLAEEDADEAIVIVLSDANLQRYGIPPSALADALISRPNVSAYAVFIGSLGDQAERLIESLPVGRAFICYNVQELPHILKQIFSSSIIS